MILSKEERDKFATWLEQDIADTKLIWEQLKTLGPHGEVLIKRQQIEVAAETLVARKLREIESMSVE